MRRVATVVAAGVLALGLAACASGDDEDALEEEDEDAAGASSTTEADSTEEPEPSETTTTTTEPQSGTEPSEPDDPTGDVEPCFDLDCEVTVPEGTEIPADGEVGITLVVLERVTPDDVQIVASGPGIQLGCGGTPGSGCNLNGVDIMVTNVDGDTATVTFSR